MHFSAFVSRAEKIAILNSRRLKQDEKNASASHMLTPVRGPRTFSRVSGSHHSANTRVNAGQETTSGVHWRCSFLIGNLTVFAQGSLETRSRNKSTPTPSMGGNFASKIGREDAGNEFAISLTLLSRVVLSRFLASEKTQFKDGAYYCYCAYVLRISRYSDFLSPVLTNTGIFLRGLKLSEESRS